MPISNKHRLAYCLGFKMNHFIERTGSSTTVLMDLEEATASTARSVLVSYFDEDSNTRHKIVSPATCTC